jgi:hypothetical protein
VKYFVLLFLLITGCTSSTEFGKCIGAFDDEFKQPDLVYKASTWNIALGVIFIETVIVPLFVVLDEAQCPFAKKSTPKI